MVKSVCSKTSVKYVQIIIFSIIIINIIFSIIIINIFTINLNLLYNQ